MGPTTKMLEGDLKENPFSRHDVMMVKTQKSDTEVFHSLNFICAWMISFKRSTLSSFST